MGNRSLFHRLPRSLQQKVQKGGDSKSYKR